MKAKISEILVTVSFVLVGIFMLLFAFLPNFVYKFPTDGRYGVKYNDDIPTSFVYNGSTNISLTIGQEKLLTYKMNSNTVDQIIGSISEDDTIAKCILNTDDHKFYIKGISEGVTKIKISPIRDAKQSVTLNVKVTKPNAITDFDISISSKDTTYKMSNGTKVKLFVDFKPYYAISTLKYWSDNPSIISVDEDGVLSANSVGTTKIFASTMDEQIKKCITISVTSATLGNTQLITNGFVQEGHIVRFDFIDENNIACPCDNVEIENDGGKAIIYGHYIYCYREGRFNLNYNTESNEFDIDCLKLRSNNTNFYSSIINSNEFEMSYSSTVYLQTNKYLVILNKFDQNDAFELYTPHFNYIYDNEKIDIYGNVVILKTLDFDEKTSITINYTKVDESLSEYKYNITAVPISGNSGAVFLDCFIYFLFTSLVAALFGALEYLITKYIPQKLSYIFIGIDACFTIAFSIGVYSKTIVVNVGFFPLLITVGFSILTGYIAARLTTKAVEKKKKA